jgi:S-formylglutathione hydrolase FrmB
MSSVMRALGLAVLVGCGAPAPIEQTGAGSGSHTAEATSTATSTTPAASTPTDAPDASSQSASTPSRVEARTFSSAALGVDKTYWVYLPRGYDGSSQRFPVVYMLHGLGGSERNWLDHGALKEAADALALHTIVVMPDGDASFYVDGPPRDSYETCLGKKPDGNKAEAPQTFCVKTPRYETYMTKDLVADVDGHYRTLAKRESRGIGGLSMGGFGALMLSMRHPDLYSAAASHSGLVALTYVGPHPWKQGAEQLAGTASEWGAGYPASLTDVVRRVFGGDIARYRAHDPAVLATKLDPNALAIYLDCGEDDDFKFDDQARYLDGVLDARGVDHTFEIAPGHHLFDFWKARLPRSLAFFDAKLARR